jgi:hypothetical protein
MPSIVALPKILTAAVTAAVLVLILAPPAAADHNLDAWCAEERDYCLRIYLAEGEEPSPDAIRLRISSAYGTFAGRYRLCVKGPDDLRECKVFRMERGDESGERSIDTKRWAERFTNQGAGEYRVSWFKFGERLGPVLEFHLD